MVSAVRIHETEEIRLMIMPDVIEHETYQDVAKSLRLWGNTQVTLLCAGSGGSSRAAIAIADAIDSHGQVIGVLHGWAMSSHGYVFAACQKRYIGRNAVIGLHNPAFHGYEGPMHPGDLERLRVELDLITVQAAKLLAQASNQPVENWMDIFNATGSNSYKLLDAQAIIAYEIAQHSGNFVLGEARLNVSALD